VNLAKPVAATIASLIEKGILVAAVSHDNASVNGALLRLLQAEYPFIVDQPCAPHILNLIILAIFNSDSVAEFVRSVVRSITIAIMNSPNLYELFIHAQLSNTKRILHRFVETRWLADYLSFVRFKLLKASIVHVLNEVLHELLGLLTEAFWLRLDLIIELMHPFATASDILQSDHSTIIDTFIQFESLHNHCTAMKVHQQVDIIGHAAEMAIHHLEFLFLKHANFSTIYWCAMFAGKSVQGSAFISDEHADAAIGWLEPWALKMLSVYFKSLGIERSDAEIEEKLTTQLGSFIRRSDGFASIRAKLNSDREAAEEKAKKKTPNARFFYYDARTVWFLWLERRGCQELSIIAVILLSINCSEAAVERSFSLQKLTHSVLRNRTKLDSVQSQMFLKINTSALENETTRSIRTTESMIANEQPAPVLHSLINVQEIGGEEGDDEEAAAPEVDSDGEDIAPDVVAELDVEHDANEQEVAIAPAHSFVYERVFNERMINFAFNYISANTLLVDQPWKKRGSAEKLRNALSICDDVLLKKEMADVVQRCIEWALHNPRPAE
jgi:hAT family C-terminal dimerisation region